MLYGTSCVHLHEHGGRFCKAVSQVDIAQRSTKLEHVTIIAVTQADVDSVITELCNIHLRSAKSIRVCKVNNNNRNKPQ